MNATLLAALSIGAITYCACKSFKHCLVAGLSKAERFPLLLSLNNDARRSTRREIAFFQQSKAEDIQFSKFARERHGFAILGTFSYKTTKYRI